MIDLSRTKAVRERSLPGIPPRGLTAEEIRVIAVDECNIPAPVVLKVFKLVELTEGLQRKQRIRYARETGTQLSTLDQEVADADVPDDTVVPSIDEFVLLLLTIASTDSLSAVELAFSLFSTSGSPYMPSVDGETLCFILTILAKYDPAITPAVVAEAEKLALSLGKKGSIDFGGLLQTPVGELLRDSA
jgi:hypothetical protein